MPHGRRFGRVLKHHHKQQPPQRFKGNLIWLEGLPTFKVHELCVSMKSFLRQNLLHGERRRAVGSLLLLLL